MDLAAAGQPVSLAHHQPDLIPYHHRGLELGGMLDRQHNHSQIRLVGQYGFYD